MKHMANKLPSSLIVFAGMFVGITRGQDVKQKWILKMKSRYGIEKRGYSITANEVLLDDIEMATYHS